MKNKKSKSKLMTLRGNTIPGYFTGTYTWQTVNDNPKTEKLDKLAHSNVLKDISSEELLSDNFYINEKISNNLSGLPLVGSLLGKIGHYGLIFTASLGLCQYYKKKSPSIFI